MSAHVGANVWRHVDADDGMHAVGRDDAQQLVLVDGRPFTSSQAIEYATTVLMFAGAAQRDGLGCCICGTPLGDDTGPVCDRCRDVAR